MAETRIHSVRDAKEFLTSQIAAQAQSEGVPLSDVERKMLFFTEVGWIRPDMAEVSEQFDRQYDQNDYERKIVSLIENTDKRLHQEDIKTLSRWRGAIQYLKGKDHYINVMLGQAGLGSSIWHRHDWLTKALLGIGLMALVAIALHYNLHLRRLGNRRVPLYDDSHNPFMWIWLAAFLTCGAYWMTGLLLGAKRREILVSRILKLVFGRRRAEE